MTQVIAFACFGVPPLREKKRCTSGRADSDLYPKRQLVRENEDALDAVSSEVAQCRPLPLTSALLHIQTEL
jgi:hypothetical protein